MWGLRRRWGLIILFGSHCSEMDTEHGVGVGLRWEDSSP